jgi:hypothetical protein
MEIRLNSSHQFLDKHVEIAAADAGCYARIKWWMPEGCRFTLHASNVNTTPATFEQHDAVIHALLIQHPDARVRTARATFESLEDWEAQRKARVA